MENKYSWSTGAMYIVKDNENKKLVDPLDTLNKQAKEIEELKKLVTEKETRISELEDKEWYEKTFRQLEAQCERLLKERDQARLQLIEKNKLFKQQVNKMKATDFIRMCVETGLVVKAHNKNQTIIDELEKVKAFIKDDFRRDRNDTMYFIDTRIKSLKGENNG